MATELKEPLQALNYAAVDTRRAGRRERSVLAMGTVLCGLSAIPFTYAVYLWNQVFRLGLELYWPAAFVFGTAGLLVLAAGLYLIICVGRSMLRS